MFLPIVIALEIVWIFYAFSDNNIVYEMKFFDELLSGINFLLSRSK